MPYPLESPSRHKWVSLQPFIGEMGMDKHLATEQNETVLASGENYQGCVRSIAFEPLTPCTSTAGRNFFWWF